MWSLNVVSSHCSLVPGVFGNQQQQHLGMIKAMLTTSLADAANPTVQALAVKATAAFILLHDNEPNIQKSFADILPSFLQVQCITQEAKFSISLKFIT